MEYIEREAVMLQINAADFVRDDNYEAGATLLFQDDVVDRISSIPTAAVRPVVRGRWKLNKDGSGTYSECGRTQKNCWDLDNWDNFCHFCGADMRGEQNV